MSALFDTIDWGAKAGEAAAATAAAEASGSGSSSDSDSDSDSDSSSDSDSDSSDGQPVQATAEELFGQASSFQRSAPAPDAAAAASASSAAAAASGDAAGSDDEGKGEDSVEKLARTVFVGNLPLGYAKKPNKLLRVLREFGDVESCRVRSVPVEGLAIDEDGNQGKVRKVASNTGKLTDARSNVNGYVVFATRRAAQAALSADGRTVDGHTLRVDTAQATKFSHRRTVFVGGLPYDATEDDVRAHFGAGVANVRLVRDGQTQKGKGFGYVEFGDIQGASTALKMHQTKLGAQELRVFPCHKNTLTSASKGPKKTGAELRHHKKDAAAEKAAKRKELKGGAAAAAGGKKKFLGKGGRGTGGHGAAKPRAKTGAGATSNFAGRRAVSGVKPALKLGAGAGQLPAGKRPGGRKRKAAAREKEYDQKLTKRLGKVDKRRETGKAPKKE